jgi:hypothetical protein
VKPQRGPEKAKVTDPSNLLPLQAFQPFNQFNWPPANIVRQTIKLDLFVNLLPLLEEPGEILPFIQGDWSALAAKPKAATSEWIVNLLPLQEAQGGDIPFNQFDWANPRLAPTSGAARDFILSSGLIGPIPPSTTTKRTFPFIANVGTLMQRS